MCAVEGQSAISSSWLTTNVIVLSRVLIVVEVVKPMEEEIIFLELVLLPLANMYIYIYIYVSCKSSNRYTNSFFRWSMLCVARVVKVVEPMEGEPVAHVVPTVVVVTTTTTTTGCASTIITNVSSSKN